MGIKHSHMGDMCVCVEYVVDSMKRQEEAITPGDNPLALFDKCHGLFYVPTGTQDRRLNVSSEGNQAWEWFSHRIITLCPMAKVVALWLWWCHWHDSLYVTAQFYSILWHVARWPNVYSNLSHIVWLSVAFVQMIIFFRRSFLTGFWRKM